MCVGDLASPAQAFAGVPEGFEEIVLGGEERIEVKLLGRTLGLYRAHVTPDTVRIEEPERLLRAVSDFADVEKYGAELSDALATAMPRNSHLASDGQAGGMYIETKTAAFIYDESNGVLNLFLSPTWIRETQSDSRFHEITSSTHSALVHNQTLNVSTGKNYRSLSVSGTGALGLSEKSFIGGNWDFSHSSYIAGARSEMRVRDLYYRHDLGVEHYAQAGRMDGRNLASRLGGNFGFSMLPTGTIDGVRVGTTMAYTNAAVAARGTPVTVLLTRDARVDAYRGNELLGTFYLRSGINTLDTSQFPEGSYLVTMRVFEDGVQVRTQSSPFSKIGGGPGAGTTQWFAQLGRAAESGDITRSGVVAAAGVRVPLPGAVSLTGGLSTQRGKLFSETSIAWTHIFPIGALSLSGAYFFGTDGTRGNTQSLSLSNGISWSVYRYQVRAAQPGDVPAYRAVGSYDTITASASMPLGRWSAMLGYTFNKSLGRTNDYADAVNDRPWYAKPKHVSGNRVSRAMQLELSRTDMWRGVSFSSRVGVFARHDSRSPRDHGFYVGVSMSHAKPANAEGSMSSYTSGGVDVRANRRDTSVNYAASQNWAWQGNAYHEVGIDLSGTGTKSASARVSGRTSGNKYGNANGAIVNSYNKQFGNSLSFSGSYVSSLAVSRDGVMLGGANMQGEPMAGVAVRVSAQDDTSGPAAEVSSSSGRGVRVNFGESMLMPVQAFSPVSLEVRDVSGHDAGAVATSVVEGLGRRELFLIPGRLTTRDVESKAVYTYVGQALDPNGMPLADSVILNGPSASLDDAGGFVAEFDRKESDLYIADGTSIMKCPLQVKDKRDVLMMVGEVRCELTSVGDLPAEIKKQARVRRVLERRYVLSEGPGSK
ncbi:TcfC E-set like domain-containing protein [Burkholderia gladioli]|uniref:TcfC E-set like domain-containing protein n=1 Tax=Burkholderia gladioli TaxID=28095 RepID=UPI00264B89F3|nr:TcfC E-set like domain-containing protein [Burkholderia gladioli]MDN7923151.1 TcfC E-set like domain-containing protein [Burkholderia gladioli]